MANRWLVVVAVASLALNAAVIAGFCLLGPRGRFVLPPLRGMKPRELREMRAMREEFDPAMDSLRGVLNDARARLYRLATDSATPAEAESLLQDIGRIRIDMNRLAYEHMRLVMAKLPPEGREEFLRRLQSGHGHRHGKQPRHRRGCAPPPPDFDDR